MLFDDGFDTVELIMAVEDGFGISIPDRDAEKIHTAGELSRYIAEAVGAAGTGASKCCPTAGAFFLARRRLAGHSTAPVQRIRPGTLIADLLPETGRRKAWRSLGNQLGIRLPALEFPPRLALLPFLGLGIVLIVGLACLSPVLVLLAPIVLVFGSGVAEFFFGTRIPRRYRTVGQISRLLLPETLRKRKPDARAWSEADVWQVTRHLIAACAGVSPSSITRRTDLIRDLN